MTRAVFLALFSHWRRHLGQLLTLVIGLALATALWSGVQAVNAEARASYAHAATDMGQGQPDRLMGPVSVGDYARLRRAGWLLSPVIEGDLSVGEARLTLTGIDPLTSPPQQALAVLGDGAISLADFVTAPGVLLAAPETVPVLDRVLGIPALSAPGLAPNAVLTDVGTAARLLEQDTLSWLMILPDQPRGLAPLASLTDLPRVGSNQRGNIAELTDSFHLNLTAFGLLSFAVGLFIVQAAIGLAFEQRRPALRTLRALGVPLPRLIGCLATELAAIGLISGIVGIALGYLIAGALLPGVAATLRGLYGASVDGELAFDPVWALSALAITLLGAGAAGALALWRVARMPLLAPANPRAWAQISGRLLLWQSAAAVALLLTSLALALWGDGLIAGFACLATLLVGAALILPAFLAGALALFRNQARSALSEWLLADARQQVPALSLALMALLLALSANIGVSTMVGSFRDTFTGWLDQRLVSEVYVTAPSADIAKAVRTKALQEADAVLPIVSARTQIAAQPADVFGVDVHATYRDHWPLIATSPGAWDRVASGTAALINEQLARRADLWPGDMVQLTPGWEIPVAAVYSDYGNPNGQAMVAKPAFDQWFPNRPVLRFALRTEPENADALIETLLRETPLPASGIRNQAQVKALSLDVFERTFLVTAALNVLTLGVAAFAMLASLLTLASLRLPQIAPVWAAGVPLAKLSRLELARSSVLALLTWLLSIPVGLLLAWVLLSVVNVEAFGWKLPMSIFPGEWLWLGALSVLAALLAATWPVLKMRGLPPADLLRVFANER